MKSWQLLSYGKSVGTYFAASLLPMLLMAAVNPLIALNMSPEDYAIYGYYNSFITIILSKNVILSFQFASSHGG